MSLSTWSNWVWLLTFDWRCISVALLIDYLKHCCVWFLWSGVSIWIQCEAQCLWLLWWRLLQLVLWLLWHSFRPPRCSVPQDFSLRDDLDDLVFDMLDWQVLRGEPIIFWESNLLLREYWDGLGMWKELMSTVWPEGFWWPKSVEDGYEGNRG